MGQSELRCNHSSTHWKWNWWQQWQVMAGFCSLNFSRQMGHRSCSSSSSSSPSLSSDALLCVEKMAGNFFLSSSRSSPCIFLLGVVFVVVVLIVLTVALVVIVSISLLWWLLWLLWWLFVIVVLFTWFVDSILVCCCCWLVQKLFVGPSTTQSWWLWLSNVGDEDGDWTPKWLLWLLLLLFELSCSILKVDVMFCFFLLSDVWYRFVWCDWKLLLYVCMGTCCVSRWLLVGVVKSFLLRFAQLCQSGREQKAALLTPGNSCSEGLLMFWDGCRVPEGNELEIWGDSCEKSKACRCPIHRSRDSGQL